jgi:hypothetical protein
LHLYEYPTGIKERISLAAVTSSCLPIAGGGGSGGGGAPTLLPAAAAVAIAAAAVGGGGAAIATLPAGTNAVAFGLLIVGEEIGNRNGNAKLLKEKQQLLGRCVQWGL